MSENEAAKTASSWNVPNQLTALRLLLSVAVFTLIPLEQYLLATVLFVVAAASDWLDGYWARRYGQVTQLGRIFDPFVDKVLICGTFIMLAEAMVDYPFRIAGWLAVLVTAREMLVTVLRSYIEQQGIDFSAKMPGKLKMVFQCGAAVSALVALQYEANSVPGWINITLASFLVLTVVFTVYSGAGYVRSAARILRATDDLPTNGP
ncbi:MAG: CDP-diacylglycerol--glycerol-3-phosphate 3-phosphatidyltransferase [Pirellulaceae bacterium]